MLMNICLIPYSDQAVFYCYGKMPLVTFLVQIDVT